MLFASGIKNFFRPDAALSISLSDNAADKQYKKLRWSVFFSATIGYSLYYVCRLSFNIIKKPLVNEKIFTESQLGYIGSALFFAYAFGKFANGFIVDRVSIRKFMGLGLLVSAIINICLGFTHTYFLFIVFWAMNGWVQSMGAPPSIIGLTRWFNEKERGTYYGFWSASHNIGEALTYLFVAFLTTRLGWQSGMWGAGFIGLAGTLIIWMGLHDSPESKGLPAVIRHAPDVQKKSVGKLQAEVLKNPYVWVLALASSFMYISRYAINSWGIFFLEAQKGYTNIQASSIVSVNAVCGIIGTVLSGLLSDKLFKGKRNIPALIFGLLNALAIALFLYIPKGHPVLDTSCMILFGLSIGVLICYLGGLMAVDIVPKKAIGAALGIVGVASYIGAGLQDIISGKLIESGKTIVNGNVVYDFTITNYFWVGAALVSAIITLFVWKAKVKE